MTELRHYPDAHDTWLNAMGITVRWQLKTWVTADEVVSQSQTEEVPAAEYDEWMHDAPYDERAPELQTTAPTLEHRSKPLNPSTQNAPSKPQSAQSLGRILAQSPAVSDAREQQKSNEIHRQQALPERILQAKLWCVGARSLAMEDAQMLAMLCWSLNLNSDDVVYSAVMPRAEAAPRRIPTQFAPLSSILVQNITHAMLASDALPAHILVLQQEGNSAIDAPEGAIFTGNWHDANTKALLWRALQFLRKA